MPTVIGQVASGMSGCPCNLSGACTRFTPEKYEGLIACEIGWSETAIIACNTTIAARMDSTRLGLYISRRMVLRNGFDTAVGSTVM